MNNNEAVTYKSLSKKEINPHAEDFHDYAIEIMKEVALRLYGGYYEPKSTRDYLLAVKLEYFLSNYENFEKL